MLQEVKSISLLTPTEAELTQGTAILRSESPRVIPYEFLDGAPVVVAAMHRASRNVSSSGESLNYKALSIQLRNSYEV